MAKKPARDPNAPKRNLSAYLLYQNAMREEFKLENPGMTFGQLAKYTSAMYSELTPSEKEAWVARAEADKARYLHELSSEGNRIPVDVDEAKILQVALDAKNWTAKSQKWIPTAEDGKKAKLEDLRDHRQSRPALFGRIGLAVECVFAHIEVEGRKIRVHECRQGRHHTPILILFVGIPDLAVEFCQAMQHEPFERWQLVRCNCVVGIKVM